MPTFGGGKTLTGWLLHSPVFELQHAVGSTSTRPTIVTKNNFTHWLTSWPYSPKTRNLCKRISYWLKSRTDWPSEEIYENAVRDWRQFEPCRWLTDLGLPMTYLYWLAGMSRISTGSDSEYNICQESPWISYQEIKRLLIASIWEGQVPGPRYYRGEFILDFWDWHLNPPLLPKGRFF